MIITTFFTEGLSELIIPRLLYDNLEEGLSEACKSCHQISAFIWAVCNKGCFSCVWIGISKILLKPPYGSATRLGFRRSWV